MSLANLLKNVAEKGTDQSKASAGGGDYTPPAAGMTGARLVGYFEVGQHEFEYQGKKKTQNEVQLVYELIGKKHPPRELEGGEKVPVRLTWTTNLSQNEKAWFFKTFNTVRDEGDKHFVQLLGRPVILNIVHEEKEKAGAKVVYANIEKGSIRKPVLQVPEMLDGEPTGNLIDQPFAVGPALTELKAFVWDFADAEMWDSIYLPGEYPERKDEKTGKVTAPAKSKNTLQLKIASALNFKGLPCYDYAASKLTGGTVTKEGVDALDNAVGDVANTTPAADDPMAGIA